MMNKGMTMIGVEITGGVKKDRELAEEIVWFCLEKMLPRHRTLNITVLLTKTYEEGAKGFCYQEADDRDFVIEIDHRLTKIEGVEEFIDTVCHEMIHVKQHATRKLIDRFRGGYKKLWKCRDGKYRNYLETAYNKQPWEIEAHRDSGKYMKEFKKEYYGYE
jgi:hypothetical protein